MTTDTELPKSWRQHAAFTNIMAAHGVEPYAKPKRKRKAKAAEVVE